MPPERLARAVISGVRYITNSPPIPIVLGRTLATGIGGGSAAALLPLVARDLLHGGAQTYGIMLGAFGLGPVIGALNRSRLRAHLGVLERPIGSVRWKDRTPDPRRLEVEPIASGP